MTSFDYATPAELFSTAGRSGLRYRRFVNAAEAIRYAIEMLPANNLSATTLEIDGQRYYAKAILDLYNSESYPLCRKSSRSR
jgi:hypothetical protein